MIYNRINARLNNICIKTFSTSCRSSFAMMKWNWRIKFQKLLFFHNLVFLLKWSFHWKKSRSRERQRRSSWYWSKYNCLILWTLIMKNRRTIIICDLKSNKQKIIECEKFTNFARSSLMKNVMNSTMTIILTVFVMSRVRRDCNRFKICNI